MHYEELVTDTEAQARRVLAWCGLDWQDAVLRPSDNDKPSTTASAAQVREPVYTSSLQKWRRYEAGLTPLRNRLVAAGIVDAQEGLCVRDDLDDSSTPNAADPPWI